MNRFQSHSKRQDSLKRRSSWQQQTSFNTTFLPPHSPSRRFPCLDDDDLVSTVVPPVTVVLEGRSICQHISLHNHASYHSLAKALRQMFVDGNDDVSNSFTSNSNNTDLDLSNAVPGHLIAYEDMENDLLLAGDLNWKDFVRVVKRIRYYQPRGIQGKEEEEHSGFVEFWHLLRIYHNYVLYFSLFMIMDEFIYNI